MKIRNGFVSNSSSSSFIIATKSNMSKKILKEYLKSHPELFKPLIDKMIDKIVSEVMPMSIEEYIADYGETNTLTEKCCQKGLTKIYRAFFSDEGDGEINEAICNALEIYHEDDSVIIEKEAGY